MTRGNQRDINRKRGEARAAKLGGLINKGATSRFKVKESDADIMRRKQAEANTRKDEEKKNNNKK